MKRIVLLSTWLLAFVAAVVFGNGARTVDKTLYAEFATTTAGDTAQVSKITPILAIMGFEYKDSISYWNPADSTDTTAHSQISWTAPMQAMILTIADLTADEGAVDSTVLGTISCSAQFVAETLGFDFDVSECADSSLATLIDSLVDIFNKVTDLTDSIDAQDSGAYIKLVSLESEGVNQGAWSISLFSSAGAPTDSCDTVTGANMVTIAMVCDSMVAAANASDTFPDYMTAYDSATFYIIQSDDAGLLFYYTFYNHADTHGTLTASQANVTSFSFITDTFSVAEFGPLLATEVFRGSGIMGWIILHPSEDTEQGFGESDSAKIWLYSIDRADSNLIYSVLDEDSCDALPCSCRVDIIHAAANDTIFGYQLGLGYRVRDSVSDTVINALYRMSVDLIITDGF